MGKIIFYSLLLCFSAVSLAQTAPAQKTQAPEIPQEALVKMPDDSRLILQDALPENIKEARRLACKEQGMVYDEEAEITISGDASDGFSCVYKEQYTIEKKQR